MEWTKSPVDMHVDRDDLKNKQTNKQLCMEAVFDVQSNMSLLIP